MKITIISNYFPPNILGGAEQYAYRLGKELVQQGVEVNVITSRESEKRFEKLDGMTIYRVLRSPPLIRISGKILGYNFNPYSYKIKSILKKTNPDAIHIHNINTTVMLYPLLKYLNIPTIMHVHDHWPICYRGTLYNPKGNKACNGDCIECAFPFGFRTIGYINLAIRERLVKNFEKKVACFITPSQYLKNKLIDSKFSKENKIKYMPLGININEFNKGISKIRNHIPTILFIGRIVAYKNPSLIIKILPKILKNIECRYIIIGRGPELDLIKNTIKEHNVVKYVDIMGSVSDEKLQLNLQEADLVVLPSIWNENSPVVIYESFSSGTPVIATSQGGAKELIDEGLNGFIIDPLNEDEWVEKIVRLLTDKDLRDKMGMNARKKAEKEFDIKDNAKKILEVYKSVLR